MSIFEIMERFFLEKEFPVNLVGEGTTLSTTVQGDNGTWPCIAQAMEDRGIFLFYSAKPQNIPRERRQAVERLISMLNYELLIGNFEIDADDGDLRFRTSVDLSGILDAGPEGKGAAPELIERAVAHNIMTMDQFLPLIEGVASGRMSVQEGIERSGLRSDSWAQED